MTGFYRRTEKWPVTASTAAAPGENGVGIDAYLRTTFAASGTYSVGVSNKSNSQYDPVTGNNDMSRGLNTTGSYQLNVQALPVDMDDSLTEAPLLGAVSATPIKVVGSIAIDIRE